MATNPPAALADEAWATAAEARSMPRAWVVTALTVLFAAAAVLCVSVLAVVSGLA